MTANEALFDFSVLQAIRWIRLGNASARELIAILNKVDSRLIYLLSEGDLTSFGMARTRALRLQVEELLRQAHLEVEATLTQLVVDTALTAADLEKEALSRVTVGVGFDMATPNPGLVRTIALTRPFEGALLSEWVATWSANDVNRTWRTIQEGLIAGDTTSDIIKAVRGTQAANYGDGIREPSRRGLEALVRTAINHAASSGRQGTWDANSDVVKKVRWISTLDSRTTPICRERDGHVYPLNSGPRPPAHINCRSTTVAILKSWREMGIDMDELDGGTRASMDGQVPDDLTYYDWLKRTSAANQREALGAKRYELFRAGKFEPQEFTNDRGHLLTLAELRKRRPSAFEPKP